MRPDPAKRPQLPELICAALGRPVAACDRLAVAVSGGPDSLALLHLAQAGFAGRVTAITVDHGLRSGSAAEAAGVAAQCARRGIAHVTLRRDGAAIARNVQAQARAARYALLGDWCLGHGHGLLLTAHHADDQAETLLMRLNRASGSEGLAGIRAARRLRPGVWLVRPLLGLRKAELVALAAGAGWQAVDDPSNHDPRHDRSRMRAALAGSGLDVPALARAAAHLADEAAALDWAADVAWQGRVSADGTGAGASLLLDVRGLPAALVQRMLARAIAELGTRASRGSDVARLAARLSGGRAGTLAGVAARPGPLWRLVLANRPQSGGDATENGYDGR
ncbi:MAG: tRNA lysidine(34) synthetase TilS [Sandarakinorhabdus sp.]